MSKIAVADSYGDAHFTTGRNLFNGNITFEGQSFTAREGILNNVKFLIYKTINPTGNAYAEIYNLTGTYGVDSKPTGSTIAISDAFDVSTLTIFPSLITFNFSGANKISLTGGTNYGVALHANVGNVSNFITIASDNSDLLHSGNRFYKTEGGSWNATALYDNIFYVYEEVDVLSKISGVDYATISNISGVSLATISKRTGVTL